MRRRMQGLLLWVLAMMFVWVGWVQGLGVNWGTQASHPLPPDILVGLLKDNGITKVKLFDAEERAMRALAHSGIQVMAGIPNDQLQRMANSQKAAANWVEANATEFSLDGGVDIRCLITLSGRILICRGKGTKALSSPRTTALDLR